MITFSAWKQEAGANVRENYTGVAPLLEVELHRTNDVMETLPGVDEYRYFVCFEVSGTFREGGGVVSFELDAHNAELRAKGGGGTTLGKLTYSEAEGEPHASVTSGSLACGAITLFPLAEGESFEFEVALPS